ncbi:MAG TPA: sigma-70 family RNA polymerase sigma factor [Fimbriimonas sp.]|nr:sigma-70 family RNA polymerase sigma factor [Fimbriimonas sp.]
MTLKGANITSMQQEFEDLLAKHIGIVFRIVRTYSRNPDDQQDLAQEVKLQLWNAFPKWDRDKSFSTWMYRIALNTSLSWVRRASVRARWSAPLTDEIAASSEDAARFELRMILDRLDVMNQALLVLTLEGLPHEEIGEVLGVSAGTVATRLSRLKQQIRDEQNGH